MISYNNYNYFVLILFYIKICFCETQKKVVLRVIDWKFEF